MNRESSIAAGPVDPPITCQCGRVFHYMHRFEEHVHTPCAPAEIATALPQPDPAPLPDPEWAARVKLLELK